ncbi:hypothetical protein QR680_009801 [Steinernema hermaphroditum]|uniref:glucuronosyltransferase n=1 Tax=Steinernema hermaphroditum TaxID=289476 RepID=A0AA39ILN6_9BILA|nr:hypothetical protein QR680_009801 [Steinernema hermaphroditum]
MKSTVSLLLFLSCAHGFKILVYSPLFGVSHVTTLGGVADILVEEGMDVTVVLPKMSPKITSNGTKLAKTITIESDPRVVDYFRDDSYIATVWTSEDSLFEAKALMTKATVVHGHQCETNLKQRELLDSLRKEKFDLGISEVFDLCGLAMFEEIGLQNHVLYQTALLPERVATAFGAPNVPSVVPSYYSEAPMHMGYKQRLKNLLKMLFSTWWTGSVLESTENVVQKVLKKEFDLSRKLEEASFVFTNADPILDFPRPTTERIVNIGGLSMPEPKPLNKYWDELITRRTSAVFVSFGSFAQSYTMPSEMKKAVLETFRRFPEVTFIWKYEIDEDEVAKDVPNVVTHKWVPQNDLLAHPNLKLFVTHAGMNSILESTRRGVPMITIPLFADQMRNAQMVKRLGTAQVFDKLLLFDSDQFEKCIREILDNPSYRKNASRLSQMMAKRPRNQREELVKHIKFAAEFGSLPEYRIPQLSFLQYYMLDIIVPCLISLVLLFFSIFRLIPLLVKYVASRKEKQL